MRLESSISIEMPYGLNLLAMLTPITLVRSATTSSECASRPCSEARVKHLAQRLVLEAKARDSTHGGGVVIAVQETKERIR